MTQFFLERKVFTYFFVGLLFVGGILGFFSLGQLEDPDFTVKKALIITPYPGAEPWEVELEVTDVIEKALQELPELDYTYSWSRAGISIIKVEIKEEYWSDRLPQVWDQVRKKIDDHLPDLPPGVGKPDVSDDFNFVYGFVLGITGDGFSYKELEDYADAIKKELSLVPGVARVELWGVQDKVVYLDIRETQLATLGITAENIRETLRIQNKVVDAGSIDLQNRRLRVAPTGAFLSPDEIGDLAITETELLKTSGLLPDGERSPVRTPAGQILRIRDIATVRPGYLEPPRTIMRHNGKPALAIQAANVAGGNVVETGRRLDKRVNEILPNLPVGIQLHKVAWQSDLVTDSINGFMISLIQAVTIVLIVLIVPSGLRMGLVIGAMLIFIILGTFAFMAVSLTPLHRMSLGAIIIAMGMMVDNSCFVSDGLIVRMQRGQDRVRAAIEAAGSQAWPLLGATIIATMTFYPIFASRADAGEYCRALFTVVAAALVFSWFVSMTLTPAMCVDVLPEPKEGGADPYDTPFFRRLRKLATTAIRHRFMTLGILGGLLVVALLCAGNVRQMFFPFATRNQLMIDYWAPEGIRIQDVAEGVKPIEEWALNHDRVVSVSTFVGSGPPRFYLPVDPEVPNPTYAQLVLNTHSFDDVDPLAAEIEPWLRENIPVLTRVRFYDVGPSDTWKFEARISGPAIADLATLRRLGDQAMEILRQSPLAREVRTEMRNRKKKIVPVYSQERGRWATVTRKDLGDATKRAYDGLPVGLYREEDDLYPILLRNVESERTKLLGSLESVQIKPQIRKDTIPLGQVTTRIAVDWEDPIIHRYARRRAVTVQASPIAGETFPSLYAGVIDQFNALDMPPGYDIFWDGEFNSTSDAQSSLLPGIIPAVVVICTIIMLLYNSIRVLIGILFVIPFAAIGIIFGLWGLDSPMGFVAILGILSLTGMMIKNMIVMTDAINNGVKDGMHPFHACVQASVSQARPIALAAGTTVLGVIPLFPDPFWNAMAASIMAGLGVGAMLTIILYPTVYATLHNIKEPPAGAPAGTAEAG